MFPSKIKLFSQKNKSSITEHEAPASIIVGCGVRAACNSSRTQTANACETLAVKHRVLRASLLAPKTNYG
jgi:hypothetical protein